MKQLKTSILMLLLFSVITGIIYPALITGTGRILFREKINGSLIMSDSAVNGSMLIGQNFTKPEYFHGRPSVVNYNAAGSGGSNYSPTNRKFITDVESRVLQARRDFNLSEKTSIPPDYIFASGSGLDPHISLETAEMQSERVASERKMSRLEITRIINSLSERQLTFYGNWFVNVLKLNLALDSLGGVQ